MLFWMLGPTGSDPLLLPCSWQPPPQYHPHVYITLDSGNQITKGLSPTHISIQNRISSPEATQYLMLTWNFSSINTIPFHKPEYRYRGGIAHPLPVTPYIQILYNTHNYLLNNLKLCFPPQIFFLNLGSRFFRSNGVKGRQLSCAMNLGSFRSHFNSSAKVSYMELWICDYACINFVE